MKNITFCSKLFFFLVVLSIASINPQTLQAATTAKYLDNTRLRESPSLTGKILKVLPAATSVTILEEQKDWYKVKTGEGNIGWSMKAYLKVETASVPSENLVSIGKKGDQGKLLFSSRIRKTPFVTNNIIEVLPEGSKLKILTMRPNWYRVEYGSAKTGWVMSELVMLLQDLEKETEKNPSSNNGETTKIGTSQYQVGTVPNEIDMFELNHYWLEKINELRAKKDLRQLVLDQRWVDTASEWAGYMGKKGTATHTRPDGKSMHKWIDTKGLDFTTRYSENGWQTNYFTENIAWGIARPTTADVKRVLDNTLAFFLAEASYNGDHYRTTYHKDWNSVGLGFYFQDLGNGKYKVFVAMHYGSLEPK